MATVFTANSSGVLVDGQPVPGILGIDYQVSREQNEIYALGSDERIAVYYGARRVIGQIRVASASPALDQLTTGGTMFQIVANLSHGETSRSVAFDDCFIERKDFSLSTGGHGETVYVFRSTRVREEDSGGAQ
jgi:hypothetical protein